MKTANDGLTVDQRREARAKAQELLERGTVWKSLSESQRRRLSGAPVSGKAMYLRVLQGKGSPNLAIKVMCLECMGWERKEVTNCTSRACPLWQKRKVIFEGGATAPKVSNPAEGAGD